MSKEGSVKLSGSSQVKVNQQRSMYLLEQHTLISPPHSVTVEEVANGRQDPNQFQRAEAEDLGQMLHSIGGLQGAFWELTYHCYVEIQNRIPVQ